MVNTTGLAVGLAVGVPCLVAIVVCVALSIRASRKFKKEVKEEIDVDHDDVSFYGAPTDSPENSQANELGNPVDSKTRLDENQYRRPDFLPSSRTNSEFSGLEQDHSRVRSGNNYLDYYDTVVPMLPPNVNPESVSVKSSEKTESGLSFLKHGRLHSHSNEKLTGPNGVFPSTGIAANGNENGSTNSNSVSSVAVDYVRRLHRNDSSGFPSTAQRVASLTPEAINQNNHRYARGNFPQSPKVQTETEPKVEIGKLLDSEPDKSTVNHANRQSKPLSDYSARNKSDESLKRPVSPNKTELKTKAFYSKNNYTQSESSDIVSYKTALSEYQRDSVVSVIEPEHDLSENITAFSSHSTLNQADDTSVVTNTTNKSSAQQQKNSIAFGEPSPFDTPPKKHQTFNNTPSPRQSQFMGHFDDEEPLSPQEAIDDGYTNYEKNKNKFLERYRQS
ncbi:hypothetical protein LJB42_003781 [Komagataella kurtzmanii]|nr:hypothetical protein LJB42_003781 [Komagataella kurtzmanii]